MAILITLRNHLGLALGSLMFALRISHSSYIVLTEEVGNGWSIYRNITM